MASSSKTPKRPTAAALRKTAAEPPRTPAARLGRRSMKTSEVVALEIVRDIVARQLQPGDKLPLEAELLTKYRVSRSSLREALRLLEVQELVGIRPGPGGGTVVGQVQPASLGRTLTLHMHLIGATYDELLDTWVLTEGLLAELAAANPDREKVRVAMTPFVEKTPASKKAKHEIAEGLEFHEAVAALAGNRVLSFLLQTAGAVVSEHVLNAVDRQTLEEDIVHDHDAVAKAIIAGNSKKARELMDEHVHHIADRFRAYWPRRVGDKIQWR